MSLFGDEFEIKPKAKKQAIETVEIEKPIKTKKQNKTKELIEKLSSTTTSTMEDAGKLLKSKTIDIKDKLVVINARVLSVLDKQRSNVQVITSLDELMTYIDKAIAKGRIAIDTETNNSTDPVTCKLMGLCLYTPDEKQVYVPVNHVNIDTRERLQPQLTEADCGAALQKIIDAKTFIIMHNGKFDYEVLKCTCGVSCAPNWDTLIGARLIDENKYSEKRTSLKYIYTTEIDPSQSKYDIEELFENIPYEVVDPNIFALYAATDSLMTDKVYLWEMPYFEGEENAKLKWLAENIEMPIVQVTAEMELTGVCIDQDLGARLKTKYDKQLEDIDKKIMQTLDNLRPTILRWRVTPEATNQSISYVPTKSKMSQEKIEKMYPEVDADGKRFKYGKSKSSQLGDPVNLDSPSQLAILFYDVLGAAAVSSSSPRGTGEDELKALAEKYSDNNNFEICKLLVKRRGLVKLIGTYIDVIPELAKHWPDGRIRYRLMSMGTDTGRFASGGKFRFLDENGSQVVLNSINSQNIPSHNPEVRLLFKAGTTYHAIDIADNYFEIPIGDEIETSSGWKNIKDLVVGDIVVGENTNDVVKNIVKDNTKYYVYV